MKGLAWDDAPRDYFAKLKTALKNQCFIDLEITSSEDEFISLFDKQRDSIDFVVTDLVNEKKGGALTGVEIAKRAERLPVYIVTYYLQKINLAEMGLGRNVAIKSKNLPPGWLAAEIREDLAERGLYVNSKKVFVIYGHDRMAAGARVELEAFLRVIGKEPHSIAVTNLAISLNQGLVEEMRDAGAVIALFTPDDEWKDGTCHPRQNVVLEVGVAMGLARGTERLIIVQRWGNRVEEQAVVPSDLGGILTVQFDGDIETAFRQIRARLEKLEPPTD